MATIRKTNNKYRAVIRRKERCLSATFSDEGTAKTWARFQEDLIDNMENFNVNPERLVTLEQCLDLKIKNIEKNLDIRTLADYENCRREFVDIMNCSLEELTPNMVKNISNKMLNSTVRRGGSKISNTGTIVISSPATVLKKLRILSAVVSFMIEKGANITNPVQVVVNQLKMSMIKKGQKTEVDIENE